MSKYANPIRTGAIILVLVIATVLIVSHFGLQRALARQQAPTQSALATTLYRVDLEPEVFEMPELVVTGEDLLADSEIGLLDLRMASVAVQVIVVVPTG